MNAQFTFVSTEDGSPTARIANGADVSEAMHSLRGAFSETVYIYGTGIETALAKEMLPRVLSMGLGLGYVEILAAALFAKSGKTQIGGGDSYELVPALRDNFLSWSTDQGHVDKEFSEVYEQILQRTAAHTNVDREEIKAALKAMLLDGRWQVHGPLAGETQFREKFGCICFDAFSSKSTPEVWGEDFLKDFLERAAAPSCVLSTYACTGALKRSLRTSGFELNVREGFASKRDSTFAVRS